MDVGTFYRYRLLIPRNFGSVTLANLPTRVPLCLLNNAKAPVGMTDLKIKWIFWALVIFTVADFKFWRICLVNISVGMSTSTEGQKLPENLAPVLVIISGKSLVFSRKMITSTGFYRYCAPVVSAPVVVINESPIIGGFEKGLAGGGWRQTNPQKEPKKFSRYLSPLSYGGGIGKRVQKRGLNLWPLKGFLAPTPSVRQPLFETSDIRPPPISLS